MVLTVKSRFKGLLLAGLAVLLVGGGAITLYAVTTPQSELYGPWNRSDEGLAIGGYDTVAYFTDGEARKGSTEFQHRWQDALWYFSNESHRDMFSADPESYAPQFGGFCSAAMTYGAVAEADPEVWAIVEGQLYLNYSDYARELFEENLAQNIAKAEQKWTEKVDATEQEKRIAAKIR